MNAGRIRTPQVTAAQLLGPDVGLELRLLAGEVGLARPIAVPRIQKPGLALTGWAEQLHDHRLLVLGGTEIAYLRAIDAAAREVGIATVLASQPAGVIICRGLEPPPEIARACEVAGVPLFLTDLVTAELIVRVSSWLTDEMAPQTSLHGVLLDVLGIGVLLLGKSGIGKSETALDLVVRGHRLVADDIVELRRKAGFVFGSGSGIIRHHMEIRGLGIINIKDLFGIAAVRKTKKVELVVELVEWSEHEEYDRLGLDDHRYAILDLTVALVRVPVRPGRNLATIIEVAARNQLLKLQGHNSALAFQERLNRAIAEATPRRNFDVDVIE